MRALLTLLLWLGLMQQVAAQNSPRPPGDWLDSLTYNYYQKRDWQSIKNVCQPYRQRQLPYYSRFRLGLAYYYSGQVQQGARLFERMYAADRLDTNALKTAHAIWTEAGLNGRAAALRRKALPALQKRLAAQQPLEPINSINAEAGAGFSDYDVNASSVDRNFEDVYSEEDALLNNLFTRVGLAGQITHRLGWRADVSYSTIAKRRRFAYDQLVEVGSRPATYIDPFGRPQAYMQKEYDWQVRTDVSSFQVKQQQVYAALNWQALPQFNITAFGLMGQYNLKDRRSIYKNEAFLAQTPDLQPSYRPRYDFFASQQQAPFYVSGLELSYQNSNLMHQLGASLGRLYEQALNQYNYQIIWYPRGNYSLFITGSASLVEQPGSQNLIYRLALGRNLGRFLSLGANGTWGNLANSLSDNGVYIYNFPEQTNARYGLNLGLRLNKHMRLDLCGQLLRMRARPLFFNLDRGFENRSQNYNLIYTGLTLTYKL